MPNFYIMLIMKYTSLASDRMMVIMFSHWIGNVIKVNIETDWILKQVVTKIGCLKIDNLHLDHFNAKQGAIVCTIKLQNSNSDGTYCIE